MKIYRLLAGKVQARMNCEKTGNSLWHEKHTEAIQTIMKQTAPSGSGIDCGTRIDLDRSTPDKLVFYAEYHHMNDGGYYDGWTEHTVIVWPSLQFGISLNISGRNRNDIKDYLHEVYSIWLQENVCPACLWREVKDGTEYQWCPTCKSEQAKNPKI